MEAWFAGLRGKRGNRMILVGDLNVAPLETDVWSHKQLLKVVSHTPAEVERFLRVQAAHDWVDVMRRHVPTEEKLFTWWSYRNRDWRASNRGRRLDHIWTTPALDGAATSMRVLDEARDWPRTSDHVPVIADFEIPDALQARLRHARPPRPRASGHEFFLPGLALKTADGRDKLGHDEGRGRRNRCGPKAPACSRRSR